MAGRGGRDGQGEDELPRSHLRPHLQQHPPPVITFSQFLDAFDDPQPTVLSVFNPSGLMYPASTSNFRGEGPSGSHAVEVEFLLGGTPGEWEGSGKIEELEDDNDSFETPRALDAYGENVPLISTPPPAGSTRRPKRGLRETLSQRSLNSTASAMNIGMQGAGSSSSSDPHEVALVKENLELLIAAQEHVKFMNTVIFSVAI